MRVSCPHCKQRFDVATMALLAEVRRLQARRSGRMPTGCGMDPNHLSPDDDAGKAQRAEAIRRRMGQEQPG